MSQWYELVYSQSLNRWNYLTRTKKQLKLCVVQQHFFHETSLTHEDRRRQPFWLCSSTWFPLVRKRPSWEIMSFPCVPQDRAVTANLVEGSQCSLLQEDHTVGLFKQHDSRPVSRCKGAAAVCVCLCVCYKECAAYAGVRSRQSKPHLSRQETGPALSARQEWSERPGN